MTTLSEFLLERITQDEGDGYLSFGTEVGPGTWHDWLMAECEAKRRIVEMHAHHAVDEEKLDSDDIGWLAQGLFDAMIALAYVYKDHPDHREDWTP